MKSFQDENTFQNYLVTRKEYIEPADSSPRVFPIRRPPHTWRSYSRVSRLFMIPSSSFTSHSRTSSQCDEHHHQQKSNTDISTRRHLSLDNNVLTSSDSFAFDNTLCGTNDDIQPTINIQESKPPPIPPRAPRQ
ncbi:unnamed protein product [Rotaria sp. Silwood1]|nr:unnamed protein product [Rotaria sp. Silwood1]